MPVEQFRRFATKIRRRDGEGMFQPACGLGLHPKAAAFFRGGNLSTDHPLQRDNPVETWLPGLVDDTHPSRGDPLQDDVA